MADEKNNMERSYGLDFKARHSSTVFACDLSGDTRYIRCDFPQCSEHGQATQAKPSWILNTPKNVKTLERHVGKEVHDFMKEQPLQCIFSKTQHKTKSQTVLETCRLPMGTKKVLAVFNLKDSQSQLGEWIALFLKASFLAEYGDKRQDFVVLTQDFVSRYELMQSIARLEFLKSYSPKVEVICVLSCHSSSQGQVFSCTPSDISKENGFEEFCSLHDMVLACQHTFEDILLGIHISSCFTLKLDCSHEDWPVDADWLTNKLKCILTGSTKEVYETGSQVCDLHVLLSTVLSPPIAPLTVGSCGERLQKAVSSAQNEEFPDLAREMGLEVLDGKTARSKLAMQGTDDQVSPPGLVISEVFVALLIERDSSSGNPSLSSTLADAIAANLCIRKASDVRCSFIVLPVTIDKVSSLRTKSSLKEKLNTLPVSRNKVLFVVLSHALANPSTGLIEAVRGWSTSRGGNKIYGVHFQEISALQAYYVKSRLKEELALSKFNKSHTDDDDSTVTLEHIAITGLVDSNDKKPHVAFPVLLYLLHLAIGENGDRLAGKGIPSGIYSKKPIGPGTCWTLEEVYMETCHVLSGLARKCSLQVLSLPVQSSDSTITSSTGLASIPNESVNVPFCTTDEKSVKIHERALSKLHVLKGVSNANTFPFQTIETKQKNTNETPGSLQISSDRYGQTKVPNSETRSLVLHGNLNPLGESVPVVVAPAGRSRKRSLDYPNDIESPVKKLANSTATRPFSDSPNTSTSSSCERDTTDRGDTVDTAAPSRTDSLRRKRNTRSMPTCVRNLNDSMDDSLSLADDCTSANLNSTELVGFTVNNDITYKSKGEDSELTSEDVPNIKHEPTSRSDENRTTLSSDAHLDQMDQDRIDTLVKKQCDNDGSSMEVTSSGSKTHNEVVASNDVDVYDKGESIMDLQSPGSVSSKGTQANFSLPCANKQHCILNKIKRLKQQNTTKSTDGKEKSQVETKCNPSLITDIAIVLDKDLNTLKVCNLAAPKEKPSNSFKKAPTFPGHISGQMRSGPSNTKKEKSGVNIPLLANVDKVLVNHYVLDLAVDFDQKVMRGSVVLFLEPASVEATHQEFDLCLDSTLVNVESVNEVFLPDDFKIPFYGRRSKADSSATLDSTSGECSTENTQKEDARTPSSVPNKPPELSLFQRLQKNFGVGLTEQKSDSPSQHSQPFVSDESTDDDATKTRKGLPSSTDINPDKMDVKSHNSEPKSTLPEFLNRLDVESSGQQPLPYQGLKYSVYGWCIKVWKEGATGKAWPRCVLIKYHTSPEGQSLTWTKDQDGKPCVFSPGAYINNRSLMPCQEPPVALSTWQAAIHVPPGCMAYMSGCPIKVENCSTNKTPDSVTHYYEMDIALPCSTLALAVGWLTYREGPSASVPTKEGPRRSIPCRVIAAPSLIDRAAGQLLQHVSGYVEAACQLLGPYPFDRLDLLVLPRCFACMGLKSPNLAFLSQSILASEGNLRVRVAHEVSHAWFGLLIGAKDWTEEWLSEGFATYVEDTIQLKAEKWPLVQNQQCREIRQVLRYRTLSSEMQETEKDMQCLRPKKSKFNVVEMAEDSSTSADERKPRPSTILKYRCSKKWTQVHYLKGYFLLDHLGTMVGLEVFDRFLHDYVQHYQGQLVNSEDFFDFFLQKFPMHSQTVEENLMHEWLESPGTPKCLSKKRFTSKENVLVSQALEEYEFWRRQETTNKRNRTKGARRRKAPNNFQLEGPEQIVLMLEKLIERENLLHTTLRQLNKCYEFCTRNAEIRHRWCELVVKHKFTPGLKDVRHFLIEDQGMGIYLFGELIISGQGKQRALAEEIFAEIGPEMDRCTFKTVSDMLDGVE